MGERESDQERKRGKEIKTQRDKDIHTERDRSNPTKHIKHSTQSESDRERAFIELSPTPPLKHDQIFPKSSQIVPNRVTNRVFGRPWDAFWAHAAARSPNLGKMDAIRQEKGVRGDPESTKYAINTSKNTT